MPPPWPASPRRRISEQWDTPFTTSSAKAASLASMGATRSSLMRDASLVDDQEERISSLVMSGAFPSSSASGRSDEVHSPMIRRASVAKWTHASLGGEGSRASLVNGRGHASVIVGES